jgi:uncharacterized membrane protein
MSRRTVFAALSLALALVAVSAAPGADECRAESGRHVREPVGTE